MCAVGGTSAMCWKRELYHHSLLHEVTVCMKKELQFTWMQLMHKLSWVWFVEDLTHPTRYFYSYEDTDILFWFRNFLVFAENSLWSIGVIWEWCDIVWYLWNQIFQILMKAHTICWMPYVLSCFGGSSKQTTDYEWEEIVCLCCNWN